MDDIIGVLDRLLPLFANKNSDLQAKKKEYARALESLSPEEVEAVLMYCLQRQSFAPTLYGFRNAMEEMAAAATGWHEPTAEEAIGEVLRKARTVGQYAKPRFSTTAIAQAVDCFGWLNICMLEEDELGTFRAQFRRIYDTLVRREKDDEAAFSVLGSMPPPEGGALYNLTAAMAEKKRLAEATNEKPTIMPQFLDLQARNEQMRYLEAAQAVEEAGGNLDELIAARKRGENVAERLKALWGA